MIGSVQKINDIYVYSDVIPKHICEKFIREFHKGFTFNEVIDGVVSAEGIVSYRSDDFLVAKDINLADHDRWFDLNCLLHTDYILPVLRDYLSNYRYVLADESMVHPETCIFSLYPKGEGKFAPHQDAIANIGYMRSLTVICYFNTVMEGGETYFFNQDYLLQPRVGSIVVFPSNFVYAHEGRPPISNDKYITVSFATVDVGDAKLVKTAKETLEEK